MKSVDSLITEDQRDVALEALQEVLRRCRAVRAVDDLMELDLEEIFRRLSATLAVVEFVSHNAIDRTVEMEKLR